MIHALAGWLAACVGPTGDDSDPDGHPDGTSVVDGAPLAFDAAHGLLVPDHDGLTVLGPDGAPTWSRAWTLLVGECGGCGGEGSSADGDGLLVSFTTGSPTGGAIARLSPFATLDFRLDGFAFPHDAVRDPADGSILVPEVDRTRIRWIAGDGSSALPIRTLGGLDEGWPGTSPNGADRLDVDGRSLLLLSHRAVGAQITPLGAVTLWDITAVGAPVRLWAYPSDGGGLDTPHGPVFRRWNGQWWLLYAHTNGATDGGSVGLAVTDDPTHLPSYVADLVPSDTDGIGPFTFLRGVELASDGTLYLTDSGRLTGTTPTGRVIRAPFPEDLAPTGASGVAGDDQVFAPLDGAALLTDGLLAPFEGRLWAPSEGFRPAR